MQINEYKCPNCSGAVKFDSSSQKMKCPFCDTEFEIDALIDYQKEIEAADKDTFDVDPAKASAWDEHEIGDLATGCCPSCGAELIGDANTIATVCPCCGNTQIVQQRVSGLLKPELVIPFKLDKKAAVAALKDFYKDKKLLPNFFKDENRVGAIQGLYVPFWLYDVKAKGHVVYKATKVKAWADKNYAYTKTDFYSVTREGGMDFDRIPVDGSEKMNDAYMDAIEPFDYGTMVEFNTPYLSGYLAEKYDVSADDCKERAVTRIKKSVEDEFRKSVQGYATVMKESSSVSVESGKVRYALFPVWVVNTKYKNENHQFIMNGQSGRLVGKLPIDKGKVFKYYALITGGVGAVFTLIFQLLRIFL